MEPVIDESFMYAITTYPIVECLPRACYLMMILDSFGDG